MNKQEIFDTVVNHLRKQGERSVEGDFGTCMYRLLKNGKMLKCAVGCLIDDDEYDPSMEKRTILSIFKPDSGLRIPKLRKLAGHAGFLRRLQHIHDCVPVASWEREFKTAAKLYSLEYTPV